MNNTTNWRVFPQFEKSLGGNDSASALPQIEATCRRLDELSRSGSGACELRARTALTAYVRLLELISLVNERRQQPESSLRR